MTDFLSFRKNLSKFSIFSTKDIRKIYPDFNTIQLNRWQRKGYIKRLLKGYYIFEDTQISKTLLYEISNTIYRPSYISMEAALQFYGLIPEGVYTITAITTKKTKKFEILNDFQLSYRSVKPELFWGYKEFKDLEYGPLIAKPEKALFDFIYLNDQYRTLEDFEGLRINVDEIKKLGVRLEDFGAMINLVNKQKNKERIASFIKFLT
ncbi:hypothetical protein GF389_00330 [Candidatus Dojkabacteria bacterium]|nr:hypothetical protein [Candidatus Dojkabacteria bacterium]